MQAIPSLVGLGGAALGAYGQAAPATKTSTSTMTPVEPGYQSQFRQSLLPKYNTLLAKAGQPVYGDAQRASFMGNLNTLANSATNNLANTLSSRTGSLNSGAFSSGATNIAMSRLGQQSNYDAMVPAANQQAELNNTSQVLGMGLNFVGRAPIGNITTSNSQETNGNFLSNLAGNLGNLAGASKPGSKTGVNPFNYLPGSGSGTPFTGSLPGEVPSNDDPRTSTDFSGGADHSGTTGLTRDPSGLWLRGGSTDTEVPSGDSGGDYPMSGLPMGNGQDWNPYGGGGEVPAGDSGGIYGGVPTQSYDPYGIGPWYNQGNPADPNDPFYDPFATYKG